MSQTAQAAQSDPGQYLNQAEIKKEAEYELQLLTAETKKVISQALEKIDQVQRAAGLNYKSHYVKEIERSAMELLGLTRRVRENISAIERIGHIEEVKNLRQRLAKALDAAKLPV